MTLSRRATLVVLGGGMLCMAVAALGAIADPERFFRAYLAGFSFWLGLGLGCLGVALIQFLTGGAWGLVTRRVFEAGAATLPLLGLLFVPILFGVPTLYAWTHSTEPSVIHKSLYLNIPFFVARAVVYFAVWSGLALLLGRWSAAQDRAEGAGATRRLRRLSVVGLLVLPLTASFAAIDWSMSLEPEWVSTLYPAMVAMGQLLASLALAIVVVIVLGRRPPLSSLITPRLLNDLGSLLLAFVMLWAYMTYFQYVLIWSGNLSEEITWYVRRVEHGWLVVAWLVVGAGFLLPFWLLLFRGLKRRARWLGSIAALLLCVHVIEVLWLIQPAFTPDGPVLDWLQPVVLLGIGGIWSAAFAWRLGALPLVPPNDPRLVQIQERAHVAG